MKIIGLTGNMGVGKSTLIECLREVQQEQVEVVKFAEPLYQMHNVIYNIISPAYTRPSNFTKDRKLLQFLGTDWGRNTISDSIWLDIWKSKVVAIKEHEYRRDIIVVSDDVRFDNEGELIKSMGGIIIKITSNNAAKRIDTTGSSHLSEKGIDMKYVDAIIENNGTIQDLKDSLLTLNTLKQLW